jgi:hypothetical protein
MMKNMRRKILYRNILWRKSRRINAEKYSEGEICEANREEPGE